jgi:hypothetical protein
MQYKAFVTVKFTLKIVTVCSSEMLIPTYQTSQCQNPDNETLLVTNSLLSSKYYGIVIIACLVPRYEKHKREQEKLEWYAAGDSRDCVRVDKNGNGLLRLWQQQLCQFNRVSMETAQAITSVYRSPNALVQVLHFIGTLLYIHSSEGLY